MKEVGWLTSGGNVYHAQNAIMNPNQEKKKTRPWGSTGLRTGTLRAFLLTGLSTGGRQRSENLKPMAPVWSLEYGIRTACRWVRISQHDEKADRAVGIRKNRSMTFLISSPSCSRSRVYEQTLQPAEPMRMKLSEVEFVNSTSPAPTSPHAYLLGSSSAYLDQAYCIFRNRPMASHVLLSSLAVVIRVWRERSGRRWNHASSLGDLSAPGDAKHCYHLRGIRTTSP